MRVVLLFVICYPIFISSINAPASIPLQVIRVKTSLGEMEGFAYSSGPVTTSVFLGIPYATAIRFENSIEIGAWNGTLDAKEWADSCVQFRDELFPVDGSDECLTFNIIAPFESQEVPYAVLVWFVGDDFDSGNARNHDFTNLVDLYVSKGVIVITVQTRVGPYGYFSLGDTNTPGNMAIWDAKNALEVIRKLAPSINGDLKRITVGGSGSGAVLAEALALSRHTTDLFNQSLLISGTLFAEWASSEKVVQASRILAEGLNCSGSSTEVKQCLRQHSNEKINEQWKSTSSLRSGLSPFPFHPRFDGIILGSTLSKTLKGAHPKPTLTSINMNESATYVVDPSSSASSPYSLPLATLQALTSDDLQYFLAGALTEGYSGDDVDEAVRSIVSVYVQKFGSRVDKAYIQILTDLMYNLPAVESLSWKRSMGWKAYLMINQYSAPPGDRGEYKGAWHGSESLILLGGQNRRTKEMGEHVLQKRFLDAVTNFLKTGDPSWDDHPFPYLTEETPLIHVALNPNPVTKRDFRPHFIQFWSDLVGQYRWLRARLPGWSLSAHSLWCAKSVRRVRKINGDWSDLGTSCEAFGKVEDINAELKDNASDEGSLQTLDTFSNSMATSTILGPMSDPARSESSLTKDDAVDSVSSDLRPGEVSELEAIHAALASDSEPEEDVLTSSGQGSGMGDDELQSTTTITPPTKKTVPQEGLDEFLSENIHSGDEFPGSGTEEESATITNFTPVQANDE